MVFPLGHAVDELIGLDGSPIYRSRYPLGDLPRNAIVALETAAQTYPTRTFLAERTGLRWRRINYGNAWARAKRIGRDLRARGLDSERPLVIVAKNSIDHALVALGALAAGIPYAPLTAARIGFVERLTPGLAFIPDAVTAENVAQCYPTLPIVRDISQFEKRDLDDGEPIDRDVTLDSLAKILLTSGSTGAAKGVLTTHRMIVSNQVAFAQIWPDVEEYPILVDWLPWTHSFGGTKIFHYTLHRAGTLYIDDGSPTPERFHRTILNLRRLRPTIYFGVPRSLAMLATALEEDRLFCRRFFSQLTFIFGAAAILDESLYLRYEKLAVAAKPRIVPLISGWGATETAPGALAVHFWYMPRTSLGVPLPGVDIALVRSFAGPELRVRGPNVTPGYWRDPDATRNAFDEYGFYRSGDAAEVDPNRLDLGFRFMGRLEENFKLSSGTWVEAGALRSLLLERLTPHVIDCVLIGLDDRIGALLFIEPTTADVAAARAFTATTLRELRDRSPSRSQHVARAALIDDALRPEDRTEKETVIAARARERFAGRLTDLSRRNETIIDVDEASTIEPR